MSLAYRMVAAMLLTPPPALRAAGFALLAVSAFMIAVHTMMLADAARRAPGVRRPLRVPLAAAAFLAAWFGLALVVGDGANFPLAGGAPVRIAASAAVVVVPVVVALALLARSRTLRAVNAAMPPAWLVWAQSYRALGFIFLFPYLHYGLVHAGFAWPAAVGDVITGVAAPFVGLALMREKPGAARWAIAWNAFGLLDLIVAPAAAILSGSRVIALYPLAIVALFAGPPLGTITHVYSLRNLLVHRRAERRVTAPAARGEAAAHAV